MALELIDYAEACQIVGQYAHPLDSEVLPVLDSMGLLIAEDIRSDVNIPPFNASTMDGFATRSSNIVDAGDESPIKLNVRGTSRAGSGLSQSNSADVAVRVMTGAPIPDGTDCVVPFEGTLEGNLPTSSIRVVRAIPKGGNVRAIGSDLPHGELIFKRGTVVTPGVAGVLGSQGYVNVSVIRRPQIAILSSGAEIVPPGNTLQAGRIYDANGYALHTATLKAGGTPRILGIAPDDLKNTIELLKQGSSADLIISSGGVSVGDYDFVKEALEQIGETIFWKVRVKPGKPLLFGVIKGVNGSVTPLIGLPGNPVSALVCFELFVVPMIQQMRGLPHSNPKTTSAILDAPISNPDGRMVFARGNLYRTDGGEQRFKPVKNQRSSGLHDLALSNALGVCPTTTDKLDAGAAVEVIIPSIGMQ